MVDLDAIIEGCKRQDPVMQKTLYDRYNGRFYAMCCRYADSEEDAKEIVADGFLAVFSSIGTYRGEGPFEGWMRTIFVRAVLKHFRHNRLRREVEVAGVGADYEMQAVAMEHNIDIRKALREALLTLKDSERILFNLIAVEEYKFREVAEMTGSPESTVKTRYYAAKERVRKHLESRLGKQYLEDK